MSTFYLSIASVPTNSQDTIKAQVKAVQKSIINQPLAEEAKVKDSIIQNKLEVLDSMANVPDRNDLTIRKLRSELDQTYDIIKRLRKKIVEDSVTISRSELPDADVIVRKSEPSTPAVATPAPVKKKRRLIRWPF